MRRTDGRETWQRLIDWDKSSTASERLAATVVATDGYTVDPSHPLGGKDGKKDGVLRKDGLDLILAVYFPRGKKSFSSIKSKFESDFEGVAENNAKGMVFVTNQEITLSERTKLNVISGNIPVDIYHVERLTTLLNLPQNYGIRLEFLDIEMTNEELIALYTTRDKKHLSQLKEISDLLDKSTKQLAGYATGGDSFPYFTIQICEDCDNKNTATMMAHHKGEFPLYDVTARFVDINRSNIDRIETMLGTSVSIGNMIPSHTQLVPQLLSIENSENKEQAFNIFMTARNGGFTQLVRLKNVNGKWLSATKVTRNHNKIVLEKIDDDFPNKEDIW